MSQTTPHSFEKIARVDLREDGKHEARFFAPWREETLTYLCEAIGVPLRRIQREVQHVRGPRNAVPSDVCERLLANRGNTEKQLTAKLFPNKDGRFLLSVRSQDLSDRAGRHELCLWLERTTRHYEQTRRAKFQIQTP